MTLILYPLTTEKGVGSIEKANKLVFVVQLNATKQAIRKELESLYGEKVRKVTTLVSADGRKKAVVSLMRQGAASEVAAKLKIV